MSTQDVAESVPGADTGAGSGTDTGRPSPVVRTILRMRVREGAERAFEAAWRTAAQQIARVPGQLGQELMRDEGDPRWFAIVSDWADRASVDAFGRSAARETLTEALRDLREDAARETFSVLATVAPEQSPVVRVEITTGVEPAEQEAFERAWTAAAHDAAHEEGSLLQELLREDDGRRYRLVSEWRSPADLTRSTGDVERSALLGPLRRWLPADATPSLLHLRQNPVRDASFRSVPAAPAPGSATPPPHPRAEQGATDLRGTSA